MAITAATRLSDFSGFLNREQAAPIFERAAKVSVAQSLAQRVELGYSGVSVPVVTGRLTAGWVAEGAQKPASNSTVALKTMDPKKLAVIAVVSQEVVRANPANYMQLVTSQVGDAFAEAFDAAAFHGTGSPFATNIDQTPNAVELGTTTQANGGIHRDLVSGLQLLVNAGKKLSGFALDDKVEPLLLGAVDSTGRPLYVDLPYDAVSGAVARPGRLINRPSVMGSGLSTPVVVGVSPAPNTGGIVGYGGDFSQAAWGVVGGVNFRLSTEATVTINGVLTSLFENNLVAILAEAEYGWLVNDTASFVKYTNHTA